MFYQPIQYQSAVKSKNKITCRICWIIVKITAECIFRCREAGTICHSKSTRKATTQLATICQVAAAVAAEEASFSNRGNSVSRLGVILMTWTASSLHNRPLPPPFPLHLFWIGTRQVRLYLSQNSRQRRCQPFFFLLARTNRNWEKCLSFAGCQKEK